jgi:hydrogenase maturation factor HypE
VCPEKHLAAVRDIVSSFGLEARRVGYVESGGAENSLALKSEFGCFEY